MVRPIVKTMERRQHKMLDVVSLFQEKETRYELGIVGVRNALAEAMQGGPPDQTCLGVAIQVK